MSDTTKEPIHDPSCGGDPETGKPACRFYHPLRDLKNPGTGQCRRHPPTAVPLQGPRGELMTQNIWVPVRDINWCGEWQEEGRKVHLNG